MQQYKKIFSILNENVICRHKDDELPYYEEITFHNHDGYEIYLFLCGNANYYTENGAKHLERGDLILTPPYAFHYSEAKSSEKYERVFINIKESLLKKLGNDSIDLSACFSRFSSDALNIIHLTEEELRRFTDLTKDLQTSLEQPEYGHELLVPALLIQILVMINKKTISNRSTPYPSIMPNLVLNTIHYINGHLTEDLSLQKISDQLHHNRDYINRCFKSATGIPIHQFIISKRIIHAQEYLRAGTPPSYACYMAGFNNYANFSRTFSKYTGISPKQYQLQQKFSPRASLSPSSSFLSPSGQS